MRTAFIMVLASSIVAGFAFRELSAGIALAETDSLSLDYLNENIQSTESASEVMIFMGEQAPGLSRDAEISLGPGARAPWMIATYLLVLFVALGVLTIWARRKRCR